MFAIPPLPCRSGAGHASIDKVSGWPSGTQGEKVAFAEPIALAHLNELGPHKQFRYPVQMAAYEHDPTPQENTSTNLVQYWTDEYQRLKRAGVPMKEIGAAFMELALRIEISLHGAHTMADRLEATAKDLRRIASQPSS